MNKISLKSFTLILTEATIVGIVLILFFNITDYIFNYYKLDSSNLLYFNIKLFISGFLFHLLFEYTGVNLWYSQEYCKLIKQ
jgi:hypothetical protein